jgi:hypothetical protein
MKEKIIILTPVYNDWKSLIKLLAKINNIFKYQLKKKFDLVVVNDFSNEHFNIKHLKVKSINKFTIISLPENLGSQRALAIGIRYINKFYKKNYHTILIDSDGQDNPEAIKNIFKKIKKYPKSSGVINRGQRKEPSWFKFLYELYCFFINFFAVKKIRFGNFSLLNSNHIKKIHDNSDLWSAFPPTISSKIKNINYITIDREKRYAGKTKMNFFKLINHALRVFSVLRYRILPISFFYLLIAFMFSKYSNYEFFFYCFYSLIILLNISNFQISLFNKKKFDKAFKKIKISNY